MAETRKLSEKDLADLRTASETEAQRGLNDTWPGDPHPVQGSRCAFSHVNPGQIAVRCPYCSENIEPGQGLRATATTPTTCIEHQVGRGPLRLSFQIKVF